MKQESTFIPLLLSVKTHQLLLVKLVLLLLVDSVQMTSAKNVNPLILKTRLLDLQYVFYVVKLTE